MPAAGMTSELYTEATEVGNQAHPSKLGEPPAAPTPIPPPTKVEVTQPAVTKRRMADEKPDGTIRDTSTEALRKGNDTSATSPFRNLSDEELQKPVEKPAEVKPEEKPIEAPKPAEIKPPEPKVYAGKFKTPEDMEKSYEELQRKLTETATRAANLEREKLAAPPKPAEVIKTPEQIAADQTEANRIVTEFVSNPKEFIEKNIVQRTMTALTAQQIRNEWLTANPDLAEHEIRVAFEATQLAQSDPELARNPQALLNKATDNFRSFTGKIRTEGAKEALTTETRVIPLVSSTAPAATEQPSPKAPLTNDAAYESHIAFLKEQEKKSHRGLRR